MKKHAILFVKLALTVGLVWYAFAKVDLSSAWATMRSVSATALSLALALLLFQLLLAALRLRELLGLLGRHCRIVTALDVVMVGAFFSQTFMSFMGGDVMRVWRITHTKIPFGVAAKAVLFDRIAGFAGLIAIVIAVMPVLYPLVESLEMRIVLLSITVGALIGVAFLFLLRRAPPSLSKVRAIRIFLDVISEGLKISRSFRGVVNVFGLSIGIHTINVLILFVLAVGLSIHLSLIECFLFMPIVLFLSMLPISIAGWGVREGAMVSALGIIGIPRHESLALSICFGLCLIAISLPGGFIWFLSRRGTAASTTANADAYDKKLVRESLHEEEQQRPDSGVQQPVHASSPHEG